jgi:integration host factor subunit alpha
MTGKTVKRKHLSQAVSERVGLPRSECATLVELVLKEILDCLERGETLKLSGFGAFIVRKKRARMGRNPRTGEGVPISAHRIVMFKPSQLLKKRINARRSHSH